MINAWDEFTATIDAPDKLSRRSLTFVILDTTVVLETDRDEVRPSTRHKFRQKRIWERRDQRSNTMQRRDVPPEIVTQAVEYYRQQITFEEAVS